ncbi:MAG: ATP-binding protein [Vulcanimicrobiaceae bacterium]
MLRSLAQGADDAVAIAAAEQALALDPYDELTLRSLLARRMGIGDHAGALQRYREFERRLREDLSAVPEEETANLLGRALYERGSASSSAIPRSMTSLIGRDDELAEILRLLVDRRVVTLVGPGGVGKTRLAIEAASRLLGAYDGGVWFVDLSAIHERDEDEVAESVRRALGASARERDPVAAIGKRLASVPSLLVLDNCEHVVHGTALLVSALGAFPQLRVLATSRHVLGVPGEHRFAVIPLGVPRTSDEGPEVLATRPAIRLFIERASTVRSNLSIDRGNAHLLAEIVANVEGLPLAIELAAARAGVLTLDGIAKRTRENLDLLRRSDVKANVDRHAALDSTIAWSVSLLSLSERSLLTALTVFPDDWDIEAAQAICGPEAAQDDIFPALSELIEASLVAIAQSAGETRYRLHATIRRYAQSMPEASDESRVHRYAAYYAQRLEEAAEAEKKVGITAYLSHVRPDYANFLQAVRFYAQRGEVSTAARMCANLLQYWGRAGYANQAADLVEQLLEPFASDEFAGAPAELCRCAGSLANARGQWEDAIRWHEIAMRAFERAGERRKAVSARLGAAHARSFAGAPLQSTIAEFEETYAQLSAENDTFGAAEILADLGAMYCVAGDTHGARERLTRALSIFRKSGSLHNAANVLRSFARCYRDDGDYAQAIEHAEQAAELFLQLGDLANAGDALRICGQGHRAMGRFSEARAKIAQALTLVPSSYEPRFAAYAIVEAARLLYATGQQSQAARLAGFAAQIQERHGIKKEPVMDEGFVQALRATLGDAFEAALLSGAMLTMDSARRLLDAAFSE